MAEQSIWRGNTSQWTNFGAYLLHALAAAAIVVLFVWMSRNGSPEVRNISAFVLVLLVIPLFLALARYLQTRNRRYELTSERIKMSRGVLNKVIDTLELYRVKDLETRQPFLYRLVGIENVFLTTSDASSPSVIMRAVPAAARLCDTIRNQVEIIRQQKRVREIDVE